MSVRFEMRGHTALLTLEDPDRRNALSRAIVREALESLERAKAQGARGIVIAGQGKAFCSGANMDDLRDGWMDGDEQDTDPVRLFRALVESPIPVTAAVHGAALGGGFELTMCCDLVVTSDTAVAHLAGALGVKTWVAVKHVPDWRWFLDRSDSPWYPSVRLFRQHRHGDWKGVFRDISVALQDEFGLR